MQNTDKDRILQKVNLIREGTSSCCNLTSISQKIFSDDHYKMSENMGHVVNRVVIVVMNNASKFHWLAC